MSKKLLQYYRSKMDVGGKVLPKYQTKGLFIPQERAVSESTSNPDLARRVQLDMALQAKRANQKIQEARDKQGTIKQASPGQSVLSKALSIAANPMTAASYIVKGQRIPDNFDKASTNIYDVATSIVNPINALYDLSNAGSDVKRGDYGSAALNLVSGATSLPSIPAYGRKYAPRFTHAAEQAIKRNQFGTLGEISLLGAANLAAPILSKAPLTRDLYKAAAYRVGKYSGGEPGGNLGNRFKNVSSRNKLSTRPYTGAEFQIYSDDVVRAPDNRDLLRQYIYGDSPGFEKSDLVPRGLEKYYDRYGDMSVFKLKAAIPEKQMVEVPIDTHYKTLFQESTQGSGGMSDFTKRGTVGVPVSHPMNNPINPLDDIGGHMTFLNRIGSNQYNLTSQDIWKFTPEDYASRYGAINPNTGLMDANTYSMYLKAKLMERAGKPFILMQENPLKFTRPSYKTKSSLGNDVDVDLYGISQEDIENSLKEMKLINKQQGGPIVSTQGYKQGPPPQGSYYRIPSDTLYNPTPYRIKAVANTGQVQYLNPFDESNINFPGADYVDEFPVMQKGGRLPIYQTKGQVTSIYVDNPNDPRLKAYSDSLTLFNNYMNIANIIKSGNKYVENPEVGPPVKITKSGSFKVPNPNNPIVLRKVTDDFSYNKIGDVGYPDVALQNNTRIKPIATETYTRKESKYKSEADYKKAAKEIKDFSERPGKASWIGYDIQKYKEPVQPVVYKKSELPTLYVDDLKDPRLRAYQDSLSAYNIDKTWEKFIRTVPDMKYTAEEIDILSDKYRIPLTKSSLWNLVVTDKSGIRKTDYTRDVLVNDNQRRSYYSPVYAKPKQRVEYRAPQPTAPVMQQPVSQSQIVPQRIPLPEGQPVYGPSGSMIGMFDYKGNKFYPDYTNRAARANVNQPDSDLITNEEKLQNYLKSQGVNPTIEKKKVGGSLDRTVTCSNCGWSWKLSDGGKDPMTCHKCGGQIKMKNGGQHGGLDRWFAEKWVDVKTGKPCGRQEGESRAGYPACRPSKRVSSKTPKTSSEMSSAEKAKFKSSKTSSKRIPYNHKRK